MTCIVLVNSGNDEGIGGNANENAYPPLGIISLGTVLKAHFGVSVQVHLIDCQVDSTDEAIGQIERLNPDILGISMYSTSIRNTVRLSAAGKSCNATVLLGNDHAAMHTETLFRGVPSIDYICVADVGEDTIVPFVEFIRGTRDVEDVPGLAYPAGSSVIRNPSIRQRSLDRLPSPDRKLLAERYWQEYSSRFSRQNRRFRRFPDGTRVSTINRARGCAQYAKPCRYCGIADLSIRFSSGDAFWADVRSARDQIGATVLYEAFDSASSAPKILEKWLHARPDDLSDVSFKMYAQAFESDERRVKLFRDLNVFCVNMGLDSGDDRVLKLLKGSRHSLQASKDASLRYMDAGIEIYTSFVLLGLGSDDATRRSLGATVEFAEWLTENSSVVSFDAALLYPDKSAPIGALIWNPDAAETVCKEFGWTFIDIERLRNVSARYRDEVYIDPLAISEEFAWICHTDPVILHDYANILQNMADAYHLNFGRSQGGPER